MRYFLYARKSTDVEDKQVLSIDAQLAELRALAKREGFEIAEEFVEKRSAKMPGRPVFEDMMCRIERGEVQGIICWKIDRLSRNPVDSGRISWLLQQGTIQKIITHDRTYLPHDNVLIMSVEFGMANEYVRQLSANTARGLRHKARLGHFPGVAPLGYLNDPHTKTIVIDRRKAPIVRRAFELYADNNHRLVDIANFLFENGIKTRAIRKPDCSGGKPLPKDQIAWLLDNPFYYGHFRYGGEIYEGKHKPIVSKELWDRVQTVLKLRSKKKAVGLEPKAFCGLLSCAECGCAITSEKKTKKSGLTYTYYHCTLKRGPCTQRTYIREDALDEQLSSLLAKFHLPEHWARELNAMAERDAQEAAHSTAASVQTMRAKTADLDGKIARITDLFVEQDIERDEYLSRKREMMSQKRSAQENILRLERNWGAWLEPMRKWIQEAQMLDGIANSKDLPSKKSSLQKIFGSNLTLHAREARGVPQNQWFSLMAAKENHSESNLVGTLVRRGGLEPPSLSAPAPQAGEFTNFSTCAAR